MDKHRRRQLVSQSRSLTASITTRRDDIDWKGGAKKGRGKTLSFGKGRKDRVRITTDRVSVVLYCSYKKQEAWDDNSAFSTTTRQIDGHTATYEGSLAVRIGTDILMRIVNEALKAGILEVKGEISMVAIKGPP